MQLEICSYVPEWTLGNDGECETERRKKRRNCQNMSLMENVKKGRGGEEKNALCLTKPLLYPGSVQARVKSSSSRQTGLSICPVDLTGDQRRRWTRRPCRCVIAIRIDRPTNRNIKLHINQPDPDSHSRSVAVHANTFG